MTNKQILKGLRIRLYPNSTQKKDLYNNIHCSRFVYNELLGYYQYIFKVSANFGYKPSPTVKLFGVILKMIKKENPFLKECIINAFNNKSQDLIKSFINFFKSGFGYPKFKSRRNSKQSFRVLQVNCEKTRCSLRIENNKLRLPKIGLISFRCSREYRNKLSNSIIKNATIILENNKWYASVLIEDTIKELPKTNENIGIDLGLKSVVTLSNGDTKAKVDLTKENSMITKYQKNMSRELRGSNKWRKNKTKLNKWYTKKKNKSKDFIHKLTTELVNKFDIIATEDLNTKGMMKNHNLAKSINEASWYTIIETLKYKSEWYGKKLVQIDRFFPSSKLCSKCGCKKKDLALAIRKWKCPECGTFHDRDINAAQNILVEALRIVKPTGCGG